MGPWFWFFMAGAACGALAGTQFGRWSVLMAVRLPRRVHARRNWRGVWR